MGNYIKIPLASNPARSFVAGALNGTATGGGTVAGTGASAAQPIVGGSGTGAQATVTKGGDATISTATITITVAGEGYKVGDVVTIAALGGGGATTWDAEISYTIVAADLVTVEGSSTNTYQMIPIDDVAFVKPVSSTVAELWTNKWDATAATALRFKVTVDDVPASTTAHLAGDLASAVNKGSQSPLSMPNAEFYNSAEVLEVDLVNA
jgi:uncharacterized membrane protein